MVAKRIEKRWVEYCNLPQRVNYEYMIAAPILQRANVSAEQFKKCWFSLLRGLSNDELFSLFKDSGFSPHQVTGKVPFVKMVLQLYKDLKVIFTFWGGGPYVHTCVFL